MAFSIAATVVVLAAWCHPTVVPLRHQAVGGDAGHNAGLASGYPATHRNHRKIMGKPWEKHRKMEVHPLVNNHTYGKTPL